MKTFANYLDKNPKVSRALGIVSGKQATKSLQEHSKQEPSLLSVDDDYILNQINVNEVYHHSVAKGNEYQPRPLNKEQVRKNIDFYSQNPKTKKLLNKAHVNQALKATSMNTKKYQAKNISNNISAKDVLNYTQTQIGWNQSEFGDAVRDNNQVSSDPLPLKEEAKYENLNRSLTKIWQQAKGQLDNGTLQVDKHYTNKAQLHDAIHRNYNQLQHRQKNIFKNLKRNPLQRNPKRKPNQFKTKPIKREQRKQSRNQHRNINRGQSIN